MADLDQSWGVLPTDSTVNSRTCVSCQQSFSVDEQDRGFYAKISAPVPSWCPSCRAQRRMAWRNEWQIFRRPDAKTGGEVFSLFTPQADVKVYDPTDWYADDWDALSYGRVIDWNRPFMEQVFDLLREVPILSRPVNDLENSDFSANANHLKNCYLVRNATETEDSAYLSMDSRSRQVFDCTNTVDCELCYGSTHLVKCYQTRYSQSCENCQNVVLSRDCIGCQDCFGCVNLRNKQYYIWNEPHTKEQYEAKLREFNLGSEQARQALAKQAQEFWLKFPVRYMHGSHNEASSGEYLYQTQRVRDSYLVNGAEDARYCQQLLAGPTRDAYDLTAFGEGVELMYESVVIGHQSYGLKYSWNCWTNCRNLEYSMFCQSSSDLFGCVGVRNKQYCILNKQYTKEEYEQLVPKVIEHMNQLPYVDKLGRAHRYGDFFPAERSPFEYNVSLAQDAFRLSPEAAEAAGYRWYTQPPLTAPIQIQTDHLPDRIESIEAAEALVGQVIACAHGQTCGDPCSGAFTLIAQEAAFLFEQGLPLPRICPSCRLVERIKQRNPMTLHVRQCACAKNGHGHEGHCPTQLETSYAPERPEIVYCESCYQAEVV